MRNKWVRFEVKRTSTAHAYYGKQFYGTIDAEGQITPFGHVEIVKYKDSMKRPIGDTQYLEVTSIEPHEVPAEVYTGTSWHPYKRIVQGGVRTTCCFPEDTTDGD